MLAHVADAAAAQEIRVGIGPVFKPATFSPPATTGCAGPEFATRTICRIVLQSMHDTAACVCQ